MEAILIYPENAEQAETVKAILKVQFETQIEQLLDYVLRGLEKGLEDVEAGRTKTFEEVKKIMTNR